MCYVCSCFGWVLDIMQRIVTFLLACWVSCAVSVGLLVAIVAGVAYGYNYSMAEFLTFTRSDVTVYMRRGQFYDQPDVRPRNFRRSGEDGDALSETIPVPSESADYEVKNPKDSPSPLHQSWMRAQDSRQYAEKLTKYNPVFAPPEKSYKEQGNQAEESELEPGVPVKEMNPSSPGYYRMTAQAYRPTKKISITPNILQPTAVYHRGSSQIIMRNLHMSTMSGMGVFDEEEKEYEGARANDFHPERPTNTPYRDSGTGDIARSSPGLLARHWGQPTTHIFQDYGDEVDEDNILYKPG